MATLLDSLRSRRSQLLSPIQGGGQTAQAQSLLRGASGRSVGTSDIGASNIGEQLEVQEGQKILQEQLAPAIQTTGEAQNIEEQKLIGREREATSGALRQRNYDTVQNRLQINNILTNLSQQRGQLDLEKQGSALEQVGFLLSMQDKKYTDDLKRVGDQRRLTDKFNMLNEMQDIVFGSSIDILKARIGRDNILTESKRDFQRQLSQMSIDEAIKISQIEAQKLDEQAAVDRESIKYGAQASSLAAATAAKYEGISGLLSGAVKGAETYSSFSDRAAERARQARIDKIKYGKDLGEP